MTRTVFAFDFQVMEEERKQREHEYHLKTLGKQYNSVQCFNKKARREKGCHIDLAFIITNG